MRDTTQPTTVNGRADTKADGAAAPAHGLPPAPLATTQERWAAGKARRKQTPRAAHAGWAPPANRADPVALLEQSSRSRLPDLVPIRYGRMLASPFTYLRGSPIVMAHDLAATPMSGIHVQLCGDAHLANFGVYASPERNLLFDVNDFDETLPGPWEYDLKRLAASFVVAGRSAGVSEPRCRDAAAACTRAYREHMRRYSGMNLLDVWYSRVDADAALQVFGRGAGDVGPLDLDKARRRNRLQALSRLAAQFEGRWKIVDNPPLVHHVADAGFAEGLQRLFASYRTTLQDDRRTLAERYRVLDFALKVVGVGSVGTRCYILLLDSCYSDDPLFLQIKEAEASVLEGHLPHSACANHGQRVVNGQRLMQSASDIFLGWTSDGERHYYVRQLRDMKGAANLDKMTGANLVEYAGLCGWVLARAHARSGDAAAIAGYLGKNDEFDEAIAAFARAYADQTEHDFAAFKEAVNLGRIPAVPGV